MVKANNDRLATAVLSMKIKYSQDSLRILKRQLSAAVPGFIF